MAASSATCRSVTFAAMAAFAPPSRAVRKLVREAIERFAMIGPTDRVAVALSGGKDSWLLWSTLAALRDEGALACSLHAVHLDQHQPGYDRGTFDRACAAFGVDCEIVSEDTWARVEPRLKPGEIPCAMCSRMRRGVLNRYCAERGYSRLALGHHLHDAMETTLLNLLWGRRLEPLTPVRRGSRTDVVTIRPLLLVEEAQVIGWMQQHDVPVVPCPVCDSQADARRAQVGRWTEAMRAQQPQLDEAFRTALYRSDVVERLGLVDVPADDPGL